MEDQEKKWPDWEIVVHHFGAESHSNVVDGPENLTEFICEIARTEEGEEFFSFYKWLGETQGMMQDSFNNYEGSLFQVAFGFGFAFGQMFDLQTEEGKAAVERLKKEIARAGYALYSLRAA
jgi:hypothetical protein